MLMTNYFIFYCSANDFISPLFWLDKEIWDDSVFLSSFGILKMYPLSSGLLCFWGKVRKKSYHSCFYCNKPFSWATLKCFSLSFILSNLFMIHHELFLGVCLHAGVYVFVCIHHAYGPLSFPELVVWYFSLNWENLGKFWKIFFKYFFCSKLFFFLIVQLNFVMPHDMILYISEMHVNHCFSVSFSWAFSFFF